MRQFSLSMILYFIFVGFNLASPGLMPWWVVIAPLSLLVGALALLAITMVALVFSLKYMDEMEVKDLEDVNKSLEVAAEIVDKLKNGGDR